MVCRILRAADYEQIVCLILNRFYEEKDAIGKRYRRQDAIGTPFCVTVDHQTKEDGTVTLRSPRYHAAGTH